MEKGKRKGGSGGHAVGRHAELIERCEVYRQLIKRQTDQGAGDALAVAEVVGEESKEQAAEGMKALV